MTLPLKILVVDDDMMMAKTLKDIFSFRGYIAEMAFSASEAIKKIKENMYSFVLSDIRMPEIDGVAFYKKIKSIAPHLPVILMTAYTSDRLVKEGLKAGVLSVINKPLKMDILLEFLLKLEKESSIAVLDDDEPFNSALSQTLEQMSFNVVSAETFRELMEKISENKGLVLLDMKLKSTDGLSVYKKIREKYPDLPVFIITAYKENYRAEIEECMNLGVRACFSKPLDIKKILEEFSHIYHKKLALILKEQESESFKK